LIQLIAAGIELKNPLPEWVLKSGDKIVRQTGRFSNRFLGDLKQLAGILIGYSYY